MHTPLICTLDYIVDCRIDDLTHCRTQIFNVNVIFLHEIFNNDSLNSRRFTLIVILICLPRRINRTRDSQMFIT